MTNDTAPFANKTTSNDPTGDTTATDIPLRVTATDAAAALIRTLKDIHGPVMFHQSGGCCDGSAPMCFALGDFKTGAQDVLLGEIEGSPFYIGAAQFEYWRHTQLIIDVVDGRGGMFSLEGPEGKRFLTRSRVFSNDEWAKLKDAEQAKA
ncbi:DUF779 domain-containing protein [Thalassospira mesophila]|uniref:DUF779 domain-containing protein n=1 Tax=Thalassospira mesophila TaxID=1293891 RepID=UPI000A1F1F64